MSLNQTTRVSHILVVDDAPDNLFLVQATLEADGYIISMAEDGKTALAKVEKLLPDLILLDVMMPEMDGYEVTERIRKSKTLPYIPILLITADDRSSVVKGLDMGADDFIRKPFDVDELLARVRSLLRLKHSIDEQEKMVRQREDFVSRLTHDLRTPLVAADRMLSLFQQEALGAISSEMHEAIHSMSRSNKNLLQMVNTLLEVYRHEAGYKNLTFSPCNLEEVMNEVVQELMPLAKERGLTLTAQVDLPPEQQSVADPKNTIIMGDRLELHRVFMNLVGNAIKFTERGGVAIHLTPTAIAMNSNTVNISTPVVTVQIKDTGTGIALNDQEDLFERFRPGAHKRSGSGLGLYLSRCIIDSHHGSIQLESEPGRGSTFTICLPIQQTE